MCTNPYVNKRTSKIRHLDAYCIDKKSWNAIKQKYQLDSLDSDSSHYVLNKFAQQPFPNFVICIDKTNSEFVGISEDHYLIRYYYNPKISSKVLNGFSKKLTDSMKDDLHIRVLTILMEYQCKEGKIRTIKIINRLKTALRE